MLMVNEIKPIYGLTAVIFLLVIFTGAHLVDAGEEREMQGWGLEDPYQRHYDVAKFKDFKARVVRVKQVVPMPGMSPAVALDVRYDDKIIEVQICPTWFAQPDEIGIKKGDRINIRGVPVTLNGKDVFIASKIKRGAYFVLKVRFTKDGRPFWTMTPEQLAEENEQEREDNW